MTQDRYNEAMTDAVLRPAWRLNNPIFERDAELFWQEQKAFPAGRLPLLSASTNERRPLSQQMFG